jgi:hypothetical protein
MLTNRDGPAIAGRYPHCPEGGRQSGKSVDVLPWKPSGRSMLVPRTRLLTADRSSWGVAVAMDKLITQVEVTSRKTRHSSATEWRARDAALDAPMAIPSSADTPARAPSPSCQRKQSTLHLRRSE